MDGLLGWTADEWSAFGALMAAAGAIGTLIVAVVAARAAFRQVAEARKLRQEQAQPYVAVYMEPSAATPEIVDLVIRNFGATAAHEVRLSIAPALQRSVQGGGSEEVWLPELLPTLVPGQEWRTMWDLGRNRKDSGLPDKHSVKVDFKDAHERPYSLNFELDWGAYKGRQWVVTYGIHDAAKALREIDKRISKWQEGPHGGLVVFVRDGDEKDRREREERQAHVHDPMQTPSSVVDERARLDASTSRAGQNRGESQSPASDVLDLLGRVLTDLLTRRSDGR
jgi:hypothetical protein